METIILSSVLSLCTAVILLVLNNWWQQRKEQMNKNSDMWEKISSHIAVQNNINKTFEDRLDKIEEKI